MAKSNPKERHEFGTSDNDIWVVTANDKPINLLLRATQYLIQDKHLIMQI